MRNRDDPNHEYRAPEPELESALVQRLQRMDWPKPPPGVRERCLSRLLVYMETMESNPATPLDAPQQSRHRSVEQSPRGLEERHWSTRLQAPPHRSPIRLPERPPRLATVL